ncbi:unnamed protein product [Orchesella dallaii]|uniref:Integral membrane protein DGCR2/IDD n=1 Tax=Orchesella dallaii TaxID=48710 RepID=A0ABP1RYH4_9HEXA
MSIPFGFLTTPLTTAGNVTNNPTSQLIQPMGKSCIDLHQRRVPHGVHFSPGPNDCTICACVHGKAKWCNAVICSPPENCKSFKIGNSSCCDFTCLDDSVNEDGENPFGDDPYLVMTRPSEPPRLLRNMLIVAIVLVSIYLAVFFASQHRRNRSEIQDQSYPLDRLYN